MKKVLIALTMTVLMLAMLLTACGAGLSGKYSYRSDYYLEFQNNGTCRWYESGMFFDGTYKKADNGFQLDIKGSGFIPSQTFTAKKNQDDSLTICGGDLGTAGQKFAKGDAQTSNLEYVLTASPLATETPAPAKNPKAFLTYITDNKTFTTVPVPGATIEIVDKSGAVCSKGVTDEKGQYAVSDLPDGEYTWQVTDVPPGYVPIPYQDGMFNTFTIKDGNPLQGETSIIMKPNQVILQEIWVDKSLGNTVNYTVRDAKLAVYDSTGKTLFEGKTDVSGAIYLEKVPAGTYTLKETAPGDGYEPNPNEYHFTVDKEGNATGDTTIEATKKN